MDIIFKGNNEERCFLEVPSQKILFDCIAEIGYSMKINKKRFNEINQRIQNLTSFKFTLEKNSEAKERETEENFQKMLTAEFSSEKPTFLDQQYFENLLKTEISEAIFSDLILETINLNVFL